jgi:hypothetical protein
LRCSWEVRRTPRRSHGLFASCLFYRPCNCRDCDQRDRRLSRPLPLQLLLSRSLLSQSLLGVIFACRDRRPCGHHPCDRCASSLQNLGWLLRAPSHCSFSVVASCNRWGGKIHSSSSRLLLLTAHPGALVQGQRPKIKFYCRMRSPHHLPCAF